MRVCEKYHKWKQVVPSLKTYKPNKLLNNPCDKLVGLYLSSTCTFHQVFENAIGNGVMMFFSFYWQCPMTLRLATHVVAVSFFLVKKMIVSSLSHLPAEVEAGIPVGVNMDQQVFSPLEPGLAQNIAMRASPLPEFLSCPNFCIPGPFTIKRNKIPPPPPLQF